MAEMKEFTVEGEVTLGHFSEEGTRISIGDERIENLIARQLGFPNDDEWDEMYQRMSSLRERGLAPAEGEPDIVREGVRLRIEVEILNGEEME